MGGSAAGWGEVREREVGKGRDPEEERVPRER